MFKKIILCVALANLGYFFIEFYAALVSGSVALFADSIDFLEDSSINLLIFFALAWTAQVRSRVGMVLALLMLIPGLATVWTVVQQIIGQQPPTGLDMTIVGLGALMVNCACAFALAKYRDHQGSLTKAAFLSARNDAAANIAIILTGGITLFFPSIWPDIIVGLAIAALNADGAREVYEAACDERVKAVT